MLGAFGRFKTGFQCLRHRCSEYACRHASTESAAYEAARSIFIINPEGRRSASPIILGLFDHFERLLGPKVGFFQPIAGEPYPRSPSRVPRHVELMHKAFSLRDDTGDMSGISRRESVSLQGEERESEMLDKIYSAHDKYRQQHDLILIEGTHQDGPVYSPENRLSLNAKIASILESPVLMVLDAGSASAEEIVDRAIICRRTIKDENADVLGLVLNQVKGERLSSLSAEVAQLLDGRGLKLYGAIPFSSVLASTRTDEVQAGLGASLPQADTNTDAAVDHVLVAAGSLARTFADLSVSEAARTLVICDGSRADVLLGLCAAHNSRAGPHVAGLLVTSSSSLDANVASIMQKTHGEGCKLLKMETELTSWEAAQKLAGLQPDILPSSEDKIEEAKHLVGKHLALEELSSALQTQQNPSIVTPRRFMHHINRLCEQNPQRIVLPEGVEPRVLRAAAGVARKGYAHITLLGEPEAIRAEARRLSVDLSQCSIVDHLKSSDLERYAGLLVEKRKHKGVTLDKAKMLLEDPNYFGCLMAAAGDVDGMVSGSTSSTANTIRPALQVLKTPSSLVSSVFFMCLPTKVLVYGDCAVNTDPDSEQLAKIGITSADTAAAFGIEPRVAFLSYSTFGSGAGPDVDKVIKAVEIAKTSRPDLLIEGPMQYDAAVDPVIAQTKVREESQVAGRATVLVVPDLNVGNIVYKAVQQSTGAEALGPIMAGLTQPVNDLSRGCTVADIQSTITCTGVQALALKEGPPAAPETAAAA